MSPVTTKIPLTTSQLPSNTNQFDELLAWVLDDLSSASRPRRVLDVGGGGSFYDFAGRLRPYAERMVGVDPDRTVLDRPWLDEAHVLTVERFADTTRDRSDATAKRFDAAICIYVLEHVERPPDFLAAVRSLLKEDASLFGITPNLWHYFGATSAAAAAVGLEDWLLHRVRPDELIEAYHCAVRYRLNTIRSLSRTAAEAGFSQLEVRGLEQPGIFETYFPAPLRTLPRYYAWLINRVGSPHLCGTLLFRLRSGRGHSGGPFS
jgi:SAM-dependent methyltransferase